MKNTVTVSGYGELIFDHYFKFIAQNDYAYIDSRGGGPVWNVLANISSAGGKAFAYGVSGNDKFGELARHDLEMLGVETENLKIIEGKNTRKIFEKLKKSKASMIPNHCFTTKCLICQNEESDNLALARLFPLKDIVFENDNNFFVCDNVTHDRLNLAEIAQKNKIITVLDLGRLNHLRYFPVSSIVSAFSRFDLVFMPLNVKMSLVKRLLIENLSDLFEISNNIAFFVTDSENGVKVYLKNDRETLNVEGISHNNIIDTSGAGDLFMANVIRNIYDIGIGNRDELRKKVGRTDFKYLTELSVKGVEKKLLNIGARGHLSKEWKYRFEGEVYKNNCSSEIFKSDIKINDKCIFCGSKYLNTSESRNKKNRGKTKILSPSNTQNTRNYLIKRIYFAMENSLAINKCKELIENAGTAYIVGTGGSYAVAEFIAISLRVRRKIFAQAIKPMDYIQSGVRSNNILIVSYSGKTRDCGLCIEHAKNLKVDKIYLLTAGIDPLLRKYLRKQDEEINYSLTGKNHERGFVSIAGTVSPAALWCAAEVGIAECSKTYKHEISKYDIECKKLEAIAQLIKENHRVHLFGTGWAKPALYDLESKFVEGDIAPVTLHESKDFSHGRFMSVFKDKPKNSVAILVRAGKYNKYEDILSKKLANHTELLEIQSEKYDYDILSAFTLLLKSQFFISRLAEKLDRDISRPGYSKIHNDGLTLYKWGRSLI